MASKIVKSMYFYMQMEKKSAFGVHYYKVSLMNFGLFPRYIIQVNNQLYDDIKVNHQCVGFIL